MSLLNDRLGRVQIGRDDEVPIESNSKLWFLWIYTDGSWDAESIAGWRDMLANWEKKEVKNVFCVWHGNNRTDLFSMNRNKLIKRLRKMEK